MGDRQLGRRRCYRTLVGPFSSMSPPTVTTGRRPNSLSKWFRLRFLLGLGRFCLTIDKIHYR